MTGFARAEGHEGDFLWRWEIKSVNARGLDIRCRVPQGFEALELVARTAVAEHFQRGSFNVALVVVNPPGEVKLALNREMLAQVLNIAKEIEAETNAAPPRLDGLLGIRGVVESIEQDEDEEDRARHEGLITETLVEALGAVGAMRRGEGDRLAVTLEGHLARIDELCAQVETLAAAQPADIRARLMERIADLIKSEPALSEERLAQESLLLASKADVREEIDRLKSHIIAARDLIGQGGAVGRRLDFLAQEFNREANTLCSKSAAKDLTTAGLDLKATIEQFREQIQNIE